MQPGKFHEPSLVFGPHGNSHALLGFRDPDFPLIQAVVLERHAAQVHFGSSGKTGRFAHGRRQPSAAVVSDELHQAFVAGLDQKVVHLFLGVRVADLDVPGRSVFAVHLAGRGHAVNAVLAHAPAAHDDQFARAGGLFFRRAAIHLRGHQPDRGHKDQALAQVAVVETDLAERRGDAALVAAVLDAFDNAVQQPPRVQVRLERTVVVPRAHAVPICTHDQLGPEARAHGVPIHADNAGQGSAVSFHVGRAVVSLAGDGIVMLIIQAAHSSVVPQNGYNPVLFVGQLPGRSHDAGLEKVVDDLPRRRSPDRDNGRGR